MLGFVVGALLMYLLLSLDILGMLYSGAGERGGEAGRLGPWEIRVLGYDVVDTSEQGLAGVVYFRRVTVTYRLYNAGSETLTPYTVTPVLVTSTNNTYMEIPSIQTSMVAPGTSITVTVKFKISQSEEPVEIRFIYVDPETMERREMGFRLEKT